MKGDRNAFCSNGGIRPLESFRMGSQEYQASIRSLELLAPPPNFLEGERGWRLSKSPTASNEICIKTLEQ